MGQIDRSDIEDSEYKSVPTGTLKGKAMATKKIYKVFTNKSSAWIQKDAATGPGLDPFGGKKDEYLEANGLDDVTMSDEFPDDDMGMQFNEELTQALNDVAQAQIRLLRISVPRRRMKLNQKKL